jgi:hypothetical protein
MKIVVALATAALLAAPAFAQEPVDGARVNQLIVYGEDPCPQSSADEIIVCARKPEGERFRIPENLRDDPNAPINNAWANRAEALEYVGRSGTESCSPAGGGGATGCFMNLIRQARAERSTRDQVNWNQLIEEARQKRLGKIDEEAEAVDREAGKPR